MGIDVKIEDGLSGQTARIDNDGNLNVSIKGGALEPVGSQSKFIFFSALLGTTGGNSGITNMAVNGSSTPVKFFIGADPDHDIFLQTIQIVISDGSLSHSKFGAISSLSVGWDLEVTEAGITDFLIEKAQSNGEVITRSGMVDWFGNSTSVSIIPNFSGSDDALIVTIPAHLFVPGGIRLGRGIVNEIFATVNDNLTSLASMEVRVFGYRQVS
ncbi:hypothetical protein IIA15_01070 [candidate division TA06 bacterium]|nr:hypothetical protein [candidate division TA06 bacterium]